MIPEKKPVKTTTSVDPNFHIYLCIGQSNMEGFAPIEEVDRNVDPRAMVFQTVDCNNLKRKKGEWYTAIPPLANCYFTDQVGLSPSNSFVNTMVNSLPDSIKVGIINVSVAGCDIRLFDKDDYQKYFDTYDPDTWFRNKISDYQNHPYHHLVQYARLAQQQGVIKGILLHQGETNNGTPDREKWPEYVQKIYQDLITDLALNKETPPPLLVGELVDKKQGGIEAEMNDIIATLPSKIDHCYVISSEDCLAQKDSVHFSSEGVRLLGQRYAKQMLELLPLQ
ncbi:sialate O-acetylesterase [Flammeovirga yaeyamensis]|uniref:Sialate O-acetylesterase n=2 Tax=Flammeovirga yaeyamensis TaxID=367791 RepID=A0AAX1N9Z3_9BACT|nr:sialate O-acetylesterase [Flammeovirga yaeyamensis]QWG04007.1 sialate O-acetylesterase [Flammeovirga yaeyamensis]